MQDADSGVPLAGQLTCKLLFQLISTVDCHSSWKGAFPGILVVVVVVVNLRLRMVEFCLHTR